MGEIMQNQYIISTTFVVEPSIHVQWYDFFTKKFVPSLGKRCVVFTRVLTNNGDAHHTYSLQIQVADIQEYQKIESENLGEYNKFCADLFGAKVLSFTTLLKIIEL